MVMLFLSFRIWGTVGGHADKRLMEYGLCQIDREQISVESFRFQLNDQHHIMILFKQFSIGAVC